MKKPVDAHPSVLIAESEKKNEFLFSMYDNTYPRIAYRGALNLIGGNPTKDFSPLETLVREVNEEFDPEEVKNPGNGKIFAPFEDINLINNSLLLKAEPFADFYIRVLKEIPGASKPYSAIFSAYITKIPQEVFEMARQHIKDGKKIVTEGLLGISNIECLKKGRITAHGTPFVLGTYLE